MTGTMLTILAVILWVGPASAQPTAAVGCLGVVSQGDGTLAEIELRTGQVAATLRLDAGPASIAASPDGKLLFATYPDRHAVGVVELNTGTRLRDLPFEGEPFGIAAGEGSVFVSDWANDRVVRVRLTDPPAIATVAVGRSPAHLVLDEAAHRLYVADRRSDEVAVIDTSSMQRLASVPTGSAPYGLALAPDGGRLYVADVHSNDVAVIDTARLERIALVAVGKLPYGVAVAPDGASILVTNQHGNSVSVVDAARLAVVATLSVGRYPEGVWAGSPGLAYVANWFSADVSVLDLAERREIRRITVGEGPRGFAPMPGCRAS